jgi:transposase InsO family protein
MGSKGGADDNAVAESFFATLKKELVHRQSWPTRRELATEVFDYSEAFYNSVRRHSTLAMLSPLEFENRTPSPHGAGFAAARLRYSHDQMINS